MHCEILAGCKLHQSKSTFAGLKIQLELLELLCDVTVPSAVREDRVGRPYLSGLKIRPTTAKYCRRDPVVHHRGFAVTYPSNHSAKSQFSTPFLCDALASDAVPGYGRHPRAMCVLDPMLGQRSGH